MPLLPHSWDYVPTFAFPGAHDGFLQASEISEYNFDKFEQMIIWGFNVSCINPENGTIYPADTSGSYYSCGVNHTFYQNMETSLQYQTKQLKTKLLKNSTFSNVPVFTYIETTNSQESYYWQHLFNSNNSPYIDWHLTLKHIGTVNCYVDGCNWQGPTYRQYDFRYEG